MSRPFFITCLLLIAAALAVALLVGGELSQVLRPWVVHNMAPIMFASLIIFLLFGYPVAFALAACGLGYALIGIELGLFRPDFLQAYPGRIYGTMSNEVLLAVPFFTFMGLILEKSGMAEDLLETIGQLFGKLRGGIAYAVVFVGTLLAATTGVVAASVISMGLISLPIMLRYGYDRRLAAGVIAASGTLAQIIPPSIVLIVLADQLAQPVGDVYQGAFLPGLLLCGAYMVYVAIVAILFPKAAPGLPPEALGDNDTRGMTSFVALATYATLGTWIVMMRIPAGSMSDAILISLSTGISTAFVAVTLYNLGARHVALPFVSLFALAGLWFWAESDARSTLAVILEIAIFANVYAIGAQLFDRITGRQSISPITRRVTFVMVPPLALIFLVLGTIFIGVATPTEAGAMGACGATLLAFVNGRLRFSDITYATHSTARLATFVLFILIGSLVFSLTFYGVNGHVWIKELLTGLPGGEIGFLVIVSILVFFLAFFLDFFELAFIVIPLLLPVAEQLGIDLVWFGIILAVNMQTAFISPPLGFSLFFLRSVAPSEPYRDQVDGVMRAPVSTADIYRGAVPFLCIQVLMIAAVIAFPGLVTHYKHDAVILESSEIDQQLEGLGMGGDDAPMPLELDFN